MYPILGFFIDGETPPSWYGPSSEKAINVRKNWHKLCRRKLFNNCSMSRLLTLKWRRKQVERDEDDRDGRRRRVLDVFTEIIDDLDGRLRR